MDSISTNFVVLLRFTYSVAIFLVTFYNSFKGINEFFCFESRPGSLISTEIYTGVNFIEDNLNHRNLSTNSNSGDCLLYENWNVVSNTVSVFFISPKDGSEFVSLECTFLPIAKGALAITIDESFEIVDSAEYVYQDCSMNCFRTLKQRDCSTKTSTTVVFFSISICVISLSFFFVFLSTFSVTLKLLKHLLFYKLGMEEMLKSDPFCNPIDCRPKFLGKNGFHFELSDFGPFEYQHVEEGYSFFAKITGKKIKIEKRSPDRYKVTLKTVGDSLSKIDFYMSRKKSENLRYYLGEISKDSKKCCLDPINPHHYLKFEEVLNLISLNDLGLKAMPNIRCGWVLGERKFTAEELREFATKVKSTSEWEFYLNSIKPEGREFTEGYIFKLLTHNYIFFNGFNLRALNSCLLNNFSFFYRPYNVKNKQWKVYCSDFSRINSFFQFNKQLKKTLGESMNLEDLLKLEVNLSEIVRGKSEILLTPFIEREKKRVRLEIDKFVDDIENKISGLRQKKIELESSFEEADKEFKELVKEKEERDAGKVGIEEESFEIMGEKATYAEVVASISANPKTVKEFLEGSVSDVGDNVKKAAEVLKSKDSRNVIHLFTNKDFNRLKKDSIYQLKEVREKIAADNDGFKRNFKKIGSRLLNLRMHDFEIERGYREINSPMHSFLEASNRFEVLSNLTEEEEKISYNFPKLIKGIISSDSAKTKIKRVKAFEKSLKRKKRDLGDNPSKGVLNAVNYIRLVKVNPFLRKIDNFSTLEKIVGNKFEKGSRCSCKVIEEGREYKCSPSFVKKVYKCMIKTITSGFEKNTENRTVGKMWKYMRSSEDEVMSLISEMKLLNLKIIKASEVIRAMGDK
jgi:hypothetical protein